MWFKDLALSKRPGQTLVTTLADTYKVSNLFNDYRIVHAGKDLYKWKDDTATLITTGALEEGVQDAAGVFVEFGDLMYYIDGVEIWQITSSFVVSAVTAYKPVVLINAAPDLSSSDDNESYNLIGAGFTVWYNGDGTATYTLPQTSLDATEIVVVVGGVTKTKTTHYTWVAATGVVTFTGGNEPTTGTNNVVITAYKTVSGNKSKIAKCTIATPYGGEAAGVTGGTRVFVTGNPDEPYTYWKSDLGLHVGYGMTYFPDTFEEVLDQNSEAITGAIKMGELLIVLKEESIFGIGYAYDGTDPYYPVRQLHDSIGCDMPGSIQLIDNRVVFCNSTNGVHALIDYNVKDEKIVKPLSANINKLLLAESDLEDACSVDYDQYYMLCVNGNMYLWDYGKSPYKNYSDYDEAQRRLSWYRWSGISALDFFYDTDLYYGGATGIVKFTSNKNDFDAAYDAYFKSKAFDFGLPTREKTFREVFPSFSSDGNIYATVAVANEDTDEFDSETYDIRSFDLGSFNLEVFTLDRIRFAKTYRQKVKMKKCVYIQIIVSGNELNRGVGLSGLKFTYAVTREIK